MASQKERAKRGARDEQGERGPKRRYSALERAGIHAQVVDGRTVSRVGAHVYDMVPHDVRLIQRAAKVLSPDGLVTWRELANMPVKAREFCELVRTYEQAVHMEGKRAIFAAARETFGIDLIKKAQGKSN